MGLGAQLPMWPDGFCARLGRPRLPRHPLRPPRHRAVGQDARAARPRLDLPTDRPLSAGPDQSRALHPGRHDPGRGRPAGSSGHHPRARGRRVAGRHDRADPGRRRAGPGRVAGRHHVDDGQAAVRAAGLAGDQAGVRLAAEDAPAEERLASEVRNIAVFNGPNFLPPEPELRRRVQELADRCTYPAGMLRQFDAVLGTRQPARLTARRSPRRLWCCTARRTPWCGRATDARLRRPFPARDSSWSTEWDTTYPNRCGRRSSRFSRELRPTTALWRPARLRAAIALMVATRFARLRRARDRHSVDGGDPLRPAPPRSRSPLVSALTRIGT